MTSDRNVVVVLPHQDDEMFIFHRLRRLVRERARVFAIWLTDGAANNPAVRRDLSIRLFFPILARERDEIIRRIRQKESTALMRHLKIPERQLHFMGYPSGHIKNCFNSLVDSLGNLLAALEPHEVYTVAFDHCEFEHDACNAAVALAARHGDSRATLYEFPVFNIYLGLPRLQRLIPHSNTPVQRTHFSWREEIERLRLFEGIFKSQSRAARLVRLGSHLPWDYRRHGEPYRVLPPYDYTQPVPGARVNYMPSSLRFQDFKEMVLAFLKRQAGR